MLILQNKIRLYICLNLLKNLLFYEEHVIKKDRKVSPKILVMIIHFLNWVMGIMLLILFFFFWKKKIYLFLTVLDPFWYKGFSLVAERKGYSLVAVFVLLIAVASLVVEHRFRGTQASVLTAPGLTSGGSQVKEHRLNSCGTWA